MGTTGQTRYPPETKHPTRWRGVRCIGIFRRFAASDGSAFGDSIIRIRHTAIIRIRHTAIRRFHHTNTPYRDGNSDTRNHQKRNTPHDGGAFDVLAYSAGSRQATEAPSAIPSYESAIPRSAQPPKTKHPARWRGVRCIGIYRRFAANDGSAFGDSILRVNPSYRDFNGTRSEHIWQAKSQPPRLPSDVWQRLLHLPRRKPNQLHH